MKFFAICRSSSSRKRKQKKKEISVEEPAVEDKKVVEDPEDKKVDDSPWDDEEDVIKQFVDQQDKRDKDIKQMEGVFQKQTSEMITEEVMSKLKKFLICKLLSL